RKFNMFASGSLALAFTLQLSGPIGGMEIRMPNLNHWTEGISKRFERAIEKKEGKENKGQKEREKKEEAQKDRTEKEALAVAKGNEEDQAKESVVQQNEPSKASSTPASAPSTEPETPAAAPITPDEPDTPPDDGTTSVLAASSPNAQAVTAAQAFDPYSAHDYAYPQLPPIFTKVLVSLALLLASIGALLIVNPWNYQRWPSRNIPGRRGQAYQS
ncbi:MAG TPA: hypothetical protein VEB60_00655, partial [Candidatus Paceibacterota bacterium]|nr:hypothetical protein [Candidatus Paceibacterota bacterium]